jgi:uncharacterized OB-fold protein
MMLDIDIVVNFRGGIRRAVRDQARRPAQTSGPRAAGYVELEGRPRVEGGLYDVDPEDVRFRMEFDVVVRPFRTTEDGIDVHTLGFAPSGRAGS